MSPSHLTRSAAPLASEIGWEQIAHVVDRFYDGVVAHPSLQLPFSSVRDWPHHKERLTYFWWVVLGGEKFRSETYQPVPKHFRAGFNAALLQEWLILFEATVREIVPDALAKQWVERATQIGAGLIIANRSMVAKG